MLHARKKKMKKKKKRYDLGLHADNGLIKKTIYDDIKKHSNGPRC